MPKKNDKRYVNPAMKRSPAGWLTLPQWLNEWLRAQPEPAGRLVERLIIEAAGLQPPVVDDED